MLFEEYLAQAQNIMKKVKTKYLVDDVLRAVVVGTIPREGSLDNEGNETYFIHGSGFHYEEYNLEIDFDFGPDSSIPGAHPWKLYNYAKSRPEQFPWLSTREKFQSDIDNLIIAGVLERIADYPSPDILKLTHTGSLN